MKSFPRESPGRLVQILENSIIPLLPNEVCRYGDRMASQDMAEASSVLERHSHPLQ